MVEIVQYAVRVGDPNVSNMLSKLSSLSFALNGNWEIKASQGSNHELDWEN